MSLHESLSATCRVEQATEADHVDGVLPQVVAHPASAEETSALLRACHQQGLAVVVRGHGSKLTWGRPPERVDVVLDTTGMDELVEHSRGDLIATAGAGMPLSRLQEQLAEGGHQLVVDDLAQGSTLGGAVATGLGGPRRMWTGAIRDLVIGVRFVRADGTIAKAGGKVVKNVAGYDLAKLLTGSYGTLAVLTQVTVRLHPLPDQQLWVEAAVPAERLADVLQHVTHSQLVPHALEVHAVPGEQARIGTLLSGTVAGCESRAQTLVEELRSLGADDPEASPEPPGWWGRLPGREGECRPVLLKTTAVLSGIPDLVAEATRQGLTVTGSAGTGVLHAAMPSADGTAADPSAAAAALDAVRTTSTHHGGSTIVLDAPPDLKAALDVWGPVPAIDLMRRVKTEFDPTRTLAPGRFVGGL
ncbi:FAD-binding oxidoreductase [Ornithinimicrobium sufpigmenti]|uniref:FAD-binding oxidoreductase n=1 Tax=Ornithinimicrobium sufpigmenti TaxID=2508882 RepID=UPI001035B6D6|nr:MULTISPECIES: FAD-binding oxidoreductase [unclassified Ornithinimicrobium]